MSTYPQRAQHGDIDNMSYEELLALGESVGKVSTGASAANISELPERKYKKKRRSTSPDARAGGGGNGGGGGGGSSSSSSSGGGGDGKQGDDDAEQRTCFVCLEEYEEGEQLRTLPW